MPEIIHGGVGRRWRAAPFPAGCGQCRCRPGFSASAGNSDPLNPGASGRNRCSRLGGGDRSVRCGAPGQAHGWQQPSGPGRPLDDRALSQARSVDVVVGQCCRCPRWLPLSQLSISRAPFDQLPRFSDWRSPRHCRREAVLASGAVGTGGW